MSNRGWLVTSPGSRRSAIVSESASYIPIFWPAFLAPIDLKNADHKGQFRLARKQAVERSADRLAFFSSLFPEVPSFRAAAEALVQKVRARRCATIGIEVTELLDDDPAMPGLDVAIDLIDRRDADYAFTVPARTVANPFEPETTVPRTTMRLPSRRFRSTRDLLLKICLIDRKFPAEMSKDSVRGTIIGHVWE